MTKTKTKQRMTCPTVQQDSRDWIFCFVGTLGRQNSTPCFVRRNTISTKTKWVLFGETGNMEWFDWMENILTQYVIMKGHETVIRNLFLLICHGKPYIWRDLIGHKRFSYIVLIILILFYGKGNFVPTWTKQKTISVLFSFLSWARVGLSAVLQAAALQAPAHIREQHTISYIYIYNSSMGVKPFSILCKKFQVFLS